jgi:lysophospholipase L1-like esterase
MKTILCYGGSNTWGYKPDATVLIPVRYPHNIRWTGILQNELKDKYLIIEEGLNSRTTVIDDPLYDGRNGKKYLMPALESHAPLDLVVLMLGTNDLKVRFSLSASEIVWAIETLVQIIRTHSLSAQIKAPDILVLSPPPVGKLPNEEEKLVWGEAQNKSKQVAHLLKTSASTYKYHLLDTHTFIDASELNVDGIHLPESSHKKLGLAVAKKIEEISK